MGASSFTSWPALTRSVRSFVTDTSRCTLPSCSAASTTTPRLMRSRRESDRPRSAAFSSPVTRRVISLASPIAIVSPPSAWPGAAAAERELHLELVVFARETLGLRLKPLHGFGGLIQRGTQGRQRAVEGGLARLQVRDRAGAGERLDAANAGRDAGFFGDDERPDIAGGAHVRAAAELDAEAGHATRRAPGRRTSRRTAPSRPPSSPPPVALASVVTGVFRKICSLTTRSMSRVSSGVTGWKCEKSNRSRSGATSEPACRTCVPSRWRSAACSRCVAV